MTTVLPDKTLRRKQKILDIYSTALITKRITLSINNIGKNLRQTLESVIAAQIEGQCVVEGFVKPESAKIITYSSGLIEASSIIYEVVFECQVCLPVEGMHIDCMARTITKAGIRADIDTVPTPIVIFIARDHHHISPYFATIKEDQIIKVRVIGQRFELNDKYVSVIAELIEPREEKQRTKKKPKIVIEQES